MKILINTISREDVINKVEAANKTGTKEEQDFIATLACPVIADEVFPVGEWCHFDEKWVEANKDILAKYPDIKEAHVVLEERTKRAMSDYGLDSFAQGLKDASVQYGEPLPSIADTVIKTTSGAVVQWADGNDLYDNLVSSLAVVSALSYS